MGCDGRVERDALKAISAECEAKLALDAALEVSDLEERQCLLVKAFDALQWAIELRARAL